MARFALASMTRPLLVTALVVTGSAAGLSRLVPSPGPSRSPCAAGHVLIGPHGVDPGEPGSLWLDRDTGRTTLLPPFAEGALQQGSCSPWRDESGRFQVVGRFCCGYGTVEAECVGLARASFPDGRLIDRVPTETVPLGPPCWYPGTGARVLFGGGDGRLYHHDFEAPNGLGSRPPRPLEWRGPAPCEGEFRLGDPCWPADPRLSRTVLAAVQAARLAGPRHSLGPWKLWWLRLSEDGRAIEEGAPVFDPGAMPEALEFRSPSVGPGRDGGLVLAGFTSINGADWDLRVAPLAIDDAGRVRAPGGPGPSVAGRCRVAFPPAFSTDGRRLAAVQVDGRGRGTILRLDLTDLPALSPPAARPDEPPADSGGPARAVPAGKWQHLASAVRALFPAPARAAEAEPHDGSIAGGGL